MQNGTDYCHLVRVRIVDIEAGKLIAILNEHDAKDLGIRAMDRIQVLNRENGKSVNVVADVTDSFVEKNEIGLFNDVVRLLDLKDRDRVCTKASGKPKSLEFIKKKMDGEKLSTEQIRQIVQDIATNKLSEIEAAEFVCAVYIRGIDLDEIVSMTNALLDNGKRIEFQKGIVVDKHSIGGTNGRSTMIITPIIAAAGYTMPKTSSRAITSSSGTADAMEVLAPVSLSLEKIREVVQKVGACLVWGGAVELAPADDKIIKIEYPLSLDPEGQVIASVMAKKASVGAKYVVIDIPLGPYVKVKSKERAEQMALKFVEVGKRLGMKIEVVLTDGSQPSGMAFGPALEAKYAMQILEGKIFDNLAKKSVELAGALLELCGDVAKGKGYEKALKILQSGEALAKMKQIISAQGGTIFSSEQIKEAPYKKKVFAQQAGIVSGLNVGVINKIARVSGAPGDKLAGVTLFVESSQKIKSGDVLFEIHAENEQKLQDALNIAKTNTAVEFNNIVIERVF